MTGTMRPWSTMAVIGMLMIVLIVPLYILKEQLSTSNGDRYQEEPAVFVGRQVCQPCHESAYQSWQGSHHDYAMAPANDSTVRGDFDEVTFEHDQMPARFFMQDGKYMVNTVGPGGERADFQIEYTFGWEPLQQYLIRFPGGRLQALSVAWDTEREGWFFLYPDREVPPDDWLHWTRGAQNWNGMCAECHSTNLIKSYDAPTDSFTTTWSEINVSCEACHGPGSKHVAWANLPPMARPATGNYDLVIRTGDTTARARVELCAPCHSRRYELGDYDHSRAHLLDQLVPSLLEPELYHADGQIVEEVYVYGSYVQSKMYRNNVRCSNCHDVHSLQLRHEGNDLCTQCHQAEVYDSKDHHFHKKVHEGEPSDGHLCVKCHMPEQPYMVVDWRADHSLRVPRPDLSLELGVPNACSQSGCHDDRSIQWAAQEYEKWYGQARKPHYGTVLSEGRARAPGARERLIRLARDPLYPGIVRATALAELSGHAGQEVTDAFNRALSDEDALVRHTAVQNLRISDAAALVELTVPLLFDEVKAVRVQAAARLAAVPDELLEPYQQEARAGALAEYIEGMEYSLDFAFANHNLGNLYRDLGDPALAEEYFRRAIEIDDLFFPPKSNLALLLNARGENAEAERLLREILEAYPDQYEVAYSLALLLVEMEKPEEGAAFLALAAEGMPDYGRLHYNLGLLQQSLGLTQGAETALRRAVELEPDNFDFLFGLADHYAKRGRPGDALAYAERMLVLQPQSPLAQDLAAWCRRAPRETP